MFVEAGLGLTFVAFALFLAWGAYSTGRSRGRSEEHDRWCRLMGKAFGKEWRRDPRFKGWSTPDVPDHQLH